MWRNLLVSALIAVAQLAFGASKVEVNTQLVEITEQQRDILKATMKIDGELTEEMHRRFWADMPKIDAREWQEKKRGLVRGFELDLRRMRAMYLSIRATLKSHTVTIDPSYAKAQADFEAVRIDNGSDDQSYQLKVAMQDKLFRDQLATVARGQPLKRGDEDIVMTDELVADVLDNIDDAYHRADRLLDPKWRDGQ